MYHQGYPISYRLRGGTPSIQISVSRDGRRADIDVDYRSSKFPAALFNGHLTSANSDVRVGGNYNRHVGRWSGLQDWWESFLRFFSARAPDTRTEVAPHQIPIEPRVTGKAPVEEAVEDFLVSWLVEAKPNLAVAYFSPASFGCVGQGREGLTERGLERYVLLERMRLANDSLKKGGPTMASKPKARFEISRREVLAAAVAASSQLVLPQRSHASTSAKPKRAVTVEKMDIERFVESCIHANREAEAQAAVLDVLSRAVHTPRAVRDAMGEPNEAGMRVLHRSKTLTIFVATWTPRMNLMPHNHLMWANIGIFAGREDNIMWRNTSESIEAFGAKALFEGDAVSLPENTIHSVTNPLLRFTGGIHIYGGDFFDTTRSQWNPETLDEEPSDGAAIREMFERENERLRRSGAV